MKKFFLILLVFTLFLSGVFGATQTFNSNGAGEFYVDVLNAVGTDATYPRHKVTSFALRNAESVGGVYPYLFTTNSTKSQQVIAYSKNKNFVPRPRAIDLGFSANNDVEFWNYKESLFASNLNKCEINFNEGTEQITSNLEPFMVYSKHTGSWDGYPINISLLSDVDKDYFNQRMEDYYFMKVNFSVYENGVVNSENFFIGWEEKSLNELISTDLYNKIAGGSYDNYTLDITEPKCDFDGINGLSSSEISEIVEVLNPNLLSPQISPIPNTIYNLNGNLVYDDNQNKKVELNLTSGEIFFEGEEIVKPVLNNFGTITIYRNGILDMVENVSPEIIALQLHKVKNLRDAEHIEGLLSESVSIMENINIEKYINYDSLNDETTIQIKLKNISASLEDLVVYEVVPKTVASTSGVIENLANAKFFIYDDDPTIGWNFEKPNATENVSYELPGDIDGGNIILFVEPVLFNEGELIVNYRSSNCGSGEFKLFGISSFDNSSIIERSQNSNYSVCVNYLSVDLGEISLNNLGDKNLDILSFNNLDVKLDGSLTSKISLYARNKTPTKIFFDLKIQRENPDGNYSCVGSINESSKRFGDCSFVEDGRIWVHLGEDLTPPTTAFSSPYLSSSASVTLTAEDLQGSGVKETFYCVSDDKFGCEDLSQYIHTYTTPFSISCGAGSECVKYVGFYSRDNNLNVEEIKIRELSFLPSGNSCNDDCTLNVGGVFWKGCNNVGACRFASHIDDLSVGSVVANKCSLSRKDAFVNYNLTHEVSCLKGNFRKSIWNLGNGDVTGCRSGDLFLKERTVKFEGRNVAMVIAICLD